MAEVAENFGPPIEAAAEAFSWIVEPTWEATAEKITELAESGINIIVVNGAATGAYLCDLTRQFPETYFISLYSEDCSEWPANWLALVGPTREDQAGFLAGMAAGFATENKYVTAISDPNSVEGRKYRNGFLHGVRYACPKCRVEFIDVADTADAETARTEAAKFVLFGSDVFFAAAGEAGDAALVVAAQKGGWVIGSGNDVYVSLFGNGSTAGADRVLTSVYLDAGEAVRAALAAFHDGKPLSGVQPLSAASGAIVLAPIRSPADRLSIPDQADIATALARLADGSLETGIDPVTGEEK